MLVNNLKTKTAKYISWAQCWPCRLMDQRVDAVLRNQKGHFRARLLYFWSRRSPSPPSTPIQPFWPTDAVIRLVKWLLPPEIMDTWFNSGLQKSFVVNFESTCCFQLIWIARNTQTKAANTTWATVLGTNNNVSMVSIRNEARINLRDAHSFHCHSETTRNHHSFFLKSKVHPVTAQSKASTEV